MNSNNINLITSNISYDTTSDTSSNVLEFSLNTSMDTPSDNLFSYNEMQHNDIIKFFTETEILKNKLDSFQQYYPTAINLVDKDWKTLLQNSNFYKKIASGFTGTDAKQNYSENRNVQTKICVFSNRNSSDTFIIPCYVNFKKKNYDDDNNDYNFQIQTNKCYLYNSGFIDTISNVLSKTLKKNPYYYCQTMIPDCKSTCNQCFLLKPPSSFCTKCVSFYNGLHLSACSSHYLRKFDMNKLMGVAVVTLTGYITWGGNYSSFKLMGIISDLMLTQETTTKPSNINLETNYVFHDAGLPTVLALEYDKKEHEQPQALQTFYTPSFHQQYPALNNAFDPMTAYQKIQNEPAPFYQPEYIVKHN